MDSMAAIRRRIRRHAVFRAPAVAFPTLHPSVVTLTPNDVWSVKLRSYVGVPLFDDTALLKCAKCDTSIEHLSDHAANLCAKGYGWKNRRNAIRDLLARDLLQAAGARVVLEAKYLLPSLQARPADILVHPLPSFANHTPETPVAENVTVSSPYQHSFIHLAARRQQAVANAAYRRKIRGFCAKLANTAGD